jgi:hypothetical protein
VVVPWRERLAKKKPAKKATTRAKAAIIPVAPVALLEDLRTLILQTRQDVAQTVNSALVLLYWQLGHRISTEILQQHRAAYGEAIVSTLSQQLSQEFGNGYSKPSLSRMMRIAEVFPNQQIVAALSKHLSWSHFVEILPLPIDMQREFYADELHFFVEQGK